MFFIHLREQDNLVSSVNIVGFTLTKTLCKSPKKKKNNNGPKVDP